MKQKISVAADLGAGGGKMAKGCFDGKKLTIEDYFNFPNAPVGLNGNLYWDLFGLYKSILEGVTRYAAEGSIVSIGVDTWGASYGLLDNRGRLLEPIYHYRDLRTQHSLDRIYELLSKRTLFELTGCQPNRSYTLPQLYSYIEHRERVLELADKLLFLPDLLEYFLCGEAVTERSIAGTSGLMEPGQNGWAMEVLKRLNILAGLLTDIVDAGGIRGELLTDAARKSGANGAKVITVPGHDTASAVVGIPGFGINQVYISIGTNINMGIELSEAIVDDKAFKGGFKNAGVIEKRKILYRDFSAFWLLNELRRTWQEEGRYYDYREIMAMAQNCSSKRVFVDTDDEKLNNAGGNAKEKINHFLKRTGQQELVTDGEFVKCILESIALKVKYCIEYLKNEMKVPVKRVSGVNGGSRNYVLMQYISNAAGMEVYGGMPYATLCGNMLTQMYALGELASVDEMRQLSEKSFDMREYTPDIAQKLCWDEDMQRMIENGVCK